MTTITDFITSTGLVMTVSRTDRNPNMTSDRANPMDHWRCTIRSTKQRGRMTLVFSMGSGHRGAEPTLANVLDCVASDASSVSESFADFCSNLGYDEDSRSAERTYKACERQAKSLRKLLGESAYETLLYQVERE